MQSTFDKWLIVICAYTLLCTVIIGFIAIHTIKK